MASTIRIVSCPIRLCIAVNKAARAGFSNRPSRDSVVSGKDRARKDYVRCTAVYPSIYTQIVIRDNRNFQSGP